MSKIYEKIENPDLKYFAVIYINPNGNKYITMNNVFCNIDEVKEYWDNNEEKLGYKYIEIVPIKNVQAFLYFKYWNSQCNWKFTEKNYDLFKYVFGCDFDILSYCMNSKID